jgi:single-strand DNA-binding protein
LNRVQLIGHLGQDPETKYTATGTARTTFSVATSRRWKDADGQLQEETEWSRCGARGALAEVCAQYGSKGSRVSAADRFPPRRGDDAEMLPNLRLGEFVLEAMLLLHRRRGVSKAAATDVTAPTWRSDLRDWHLRRPRRLC